MIDSRKNSQHRKLKSMNFTSNLNHLKQTIREEMSEQSDEEKNDQESISGLSLNKKRYSQATNSNYKGGTRSPINGPSSPAKSQYKMKTHTK